MIYFDVTDIVQYAHGNSRVSGIQRVQLKLIASLAQRLGPSRIACAFWHPKLKRITSFDPNLVFVGGELNSDKLLIQLDQIRIGLLPPRSEMRKYLAPYERRKLARALVKFYVWGVALLDNGRLETMGIDGKRRFRDEPMVPMRTHDRLPREDVYVFLGSNWSHTEIMDFGRAHAAAGGTVIQMIYDLIPHVNPEHCSASLVESFRSFLRHTTDYANAFTCISEWTRNEFVDFLAGQGMVRDVTATPLAHEFDGFARNQAVERPESADVAELAGSRFVLCVGTIERRKNGVALLEAWARLVRERGAQNVPDLVFAGKMGLGSRDFVDALASMPELASKVRTFNAPSDHDLAYLYSQAAFCVFPSLSEGWGLPLGEAAWFGRYTIASHATSLPEVCAELIDYVDPRSVDDIASKLAHALDHPQYVHDKEQRIRSAQLRTWEQVADSLLAVIERRPGSRPAAHAAEAGDHARHLQPATRKAAG